MSKITILTVQRWGSSLAVRIPAAVAKSARLKPELTLPQKLVAFDPARHGGEAMATRDMIG